MKTLHLPLNQPKKAQISDLHQALNKLRLPVDTQEVKKQVLGETTTAAIKAFQKQSGLKADGNLNEKTLAKLNQELTHLYYAGNKSRTTRIQEMLGRLDLNVAPEEMKTKQFGESTSKAIEAFQEKFGIPVDGKLTDELVASIEAAAVKARFSTKTQIGQIQQTLLRAGKIGKLEIKIEEAELKAKNFGATTTAAIRAFQQKYKLPETGELDPATVERISSVAASRPQPLKKLKAGASQNLPAVGGGALRLNKASGRVGELQQVLAHMGYKIDQQEFNTTTFGKTTRKAVLEFQKSSGLAQTGHADKETLTAVNRYVQKMNPGATQSEYSYRVRGSVRDDLWAGKAGMRIEVFEKVLRGENVLLASRPTLSNGFYDIPYDPPRNPVDGQIKSPFHLLICFSERQADGTYKKITEKTIFNPALIAWANITEGEEKYQGTSEFETRINAIRKKVGDNVAIDTLEEKDDNPEVTFVAMQTGLNPEDVMRLVLAHLSANSLNHAPIDAAVFYAFIRQNLPTTLPPELLNASEGWEMIDQLVYNAVSGLLLMPPDLQLAAFDNAIKDNLIPISVTRKKEAIIEALGLLKIDFTLNSGSLSGNGTLKSLLDASTVQEQRYEKVAQAFIENQGLTTEFWTALKAAPDDFGGIAAVKDLETTADIGHISKHHAPMLTFMKQQIADPNVAEFTKAKDFAKITTERWAQLIQQNGSQVPEGVDGDTPAEKIQTYAAILANQSERLYPAVAITAAVGRSADTGLAHVPAVQTFFDTDNLDVRTTNLDKFIADNNVAIAPEALAEAKVLQRVNRLTNSSATAVALLNEKIHSSAQIYFQGKERFTATLKKQGIPEGAAYDLFLRAEFQYSHLLGLLTDWRHELHRANPAAIVNYTVSREERQQLTGDVPDLELLFGPLDYCDCEHCQSVYSPAAYLTDLLRWLDTFPSDSNPNRSVADVLLARRLDLQNIKLNCDNTNVPLPYIDLVCEVLEQVMPPISADFSFQTTRSQKELKAFPENVRKEAYNSLRSANFPMNSTFDLWQEEARVFLKHLGVVRYELMDAFQNRSNAAALSPTDISIAGEYFEMSSHETGIVISNTDAVKAKQDQYWGLDTNQTSVSVADFMKRSKLSYYELLDLLSVRWINDLASPQRIEIERPVDTCNTEQQMVIRLTLQRYDQLHRFIRLWRRSSWAMWELDLLIRAPRVGNNALDGNCLVQLHRFKKVQEKTGLRFEQVLSFFNGINTETRVKPDQPEKEIKPLFDILFKNKAVINPIDPVFEAPLDGSESIAEHKPALLAAFAIRESDLDLLLAKTDGALTMANLSLLHNFVNLAKGIKVGVKDLLTILEIAGVAAPFASPKALLDIIKQYEWIKSSEFSIEELDYVLGHKPDSSAGIREEMITRHVEAIRQSLREVTRMNGLIVSTEYTNQIKSQVATTFAITDEQAGLLLDNLNLAGNILGHFSDERLIIKNQDGTYTNPIDRVTFPDIYNALVLLHKAALVLRRFKINEKTELEWFLTQYTIGSTLNLNSLPVTAAPAQSLFTQWERLAKWLDFKRRFPEPEEISLRRIYELSVTAGANTPQFLDALSLLTNWDRAYLEQLHNSLGFNLGAGNSYTDPDTYLRLTDCFDQVKRLGVAPALCFEWADRDENTGDAQFNIAQQIRQASKSKYDYEAWLSLITPFQDELRERKRKALVSWHMEQSQRTQPAEIMVSGKRVFNPRYFNDSNDLLNYYLIDVEMGACMLTSRIKQAISSVQMFVQRCFLNLEKPEIIITQSEATNVSDLDSWSQWKWMKNYRVWEANRKVFLYPENWIEPELRDDKSPFFKEMENEIMQNEITHENVEAAFLSYLHKVNEVARLEVVGVYHELIEDVNLLHVVGRTQSSPSLYFYRKFDLNYNTWTAWEKIEVDIMGDHLVPVVYNRKLHLFWLSFVEKPQKVRKSPPAQASSAPTDTPDAPKMLEIQLAWSVRKKDGWTAKKLSKQKLIHPWPRPTFSYNLKPRYKSRENQLWLDVYISTSEEFNNTRHYDPYTDSYVYLTGTRWDETALPWHSSSFVFDGEIIATRLKPLLGAYHPLQSDGKVANSWQSMTSYDYVHTNFSADGQAIEALSGRYAIAPRLVLPAGMHLENNHLVNNKRRLNASQASVVEYGQSKLLLSGGRNPFRLAVSQQNIQFDTGNYERPFFYQDNERAFFVKPEWQEILRSYNQTTRLHRYVFYPFYHPYTPLFIRELNRSGLDGLLNRRIQLYPHQFFPQNTFNFNAYQPASPNVPDVTATNDRLDFSLYGAYSIYNWELFFHGPLLIANKLMQNQRFEESMRWFHYIFDPTNVDGNQIPQRYWITKPFYEQNADDYNSQRVDNLLKNIQQHIDQLRNWKNNPFKPHLVARYRPVAYQKAVVMKYLDNLIAWGDQLFRRDTIESINEATQLYVMAYELLGRRPIKVPNMKHRDLCYKEIAPGIDLFGNNRIEVLIENFATVPIRPIRAVNGSEPLPRMEMFYFCLPTNDKLLGYWDKVEDRLFKIRNCMNIEGVVRQLPLFEPPIDPALLVKAAAAGVDLSSVLNDMAVPTGHYRFRLLAQKAAEFCAEVKVLGDKVLSVLEKKDAESLTLLRSTHEIELLQAIKEVRKLQIKEAKEMWAGLEKSLEMAQEKKIYYESREFINVLEGVSIGLSGGAILVSGILSLSEFLAAGFHFGPSFNIGVSGFGGSPEVTVQWGTDNIARGMQAINSGIQHIGSVLSQSSSLINTLGVYQRRMEEWGFQGRLADHEINQIDKQIEAAKIRFSIAEKELENQELQIENAQVTDEYMHSKYTNQQLYDWMLGQLATVYFQSYQLAYDMAKRAEKCYQFELGVPSSSYIQFGYWDSLKKGLLAGEKLSNDIRRLEAAYLDQNKRELEITKHISLAQLMPLKLLELRESGACNIVLPEWLFDLDYPGHYRRRIKAVSVSIPCITGPYTSVNCTLTLTNNGIRLKDDVATGYGDPLAPDTDRFIKNVIPTSSIATSSAQNDSGTFELNFNDERYLPFEGAGAVSEWRIEMPKENNQFDFSTISDVILHLRYTASSGSQALKNAAKLNLTAILPTSGLRLFSLKHEFPSEWHKFFYPAVGGADQEMTFKIEDVHLPFLFRGNNVQLDPAQTLHILIETVYNGNFEVHLTPPTQIAATSGPAALDPAMGNLPHFSAAPQAPVKGEWKLKLKKATAANFRSLQPDDIKNCFLLLAFKIT